MRGEQNVYELLTQGESRADRFRKYGKTGQPVPATETYRKVLSSLIRDGIKVEKWIIVNERDHTVTFAMTYNGVAGAHFDAVRNTQWLSWEHLRARLEDYQYVAADECPIAKPVSLRFVGESHHTETFAVTYG